MGNVNDDQVFDILTKSPLLEIIKKVFMLPGTVELNAKMKFESILMLGFIIHREDKDSKIETKQK